MLENSCAGSSSLKYQQTKLNKSVFLYLVIKVIYVKKVIVESNSVDLCLVTYLLNSYLVQLLFCKQFCKRIEQCLLLSFVCGRSGAFSLIDITSLLYHFNKYTIIKQSLQYPKHKFLCCTFFYNLTRIVA